MYTQYCKLRRLKISINASDLDSDTLNILFAMQSKIDEIEAKEREARSRLSDKGKNRL